MRLLVVSCLVSLPMLGSAFAAQDPKVPDALKRKLVVPTIVAMTDCLAREVLRSADAQNKTEIPEIRVEIDSAIPKCGMMLKPMIETYDAVYGPGAGQAFFDGPYSKDVERAVDTRMSDPHFPHGSEPEVKTVYVNVPGPTVEKVVVQECPTAPHPADQAKPDKLEQPSVPAAPEKLSMTTEEKSVVEQAKNQTQAEGLMVDPKGYNSKLGLAVYQNHLNDYMACIKSKILTGSIGRDETVPNAKDKSCLYEMALEGNSCGVYFGKYELENKLNTSASNFCTLSYAFARVKLSDEFKIQIVGNELDKADEVVSAETFDQPRDNITTGEVYSFSRDIPPTFNVDLRCGLLSPIQTRNQCIQEEQGTYDALKYSWLTIDKRAKIKCSREMWHFAGKHVGEIYPTMPYRMYLSCVASWDDYFKNNAPDSAVKKFRQ